MIPDFRARLRVAPRRLAVAAALLPGLLVSACRNSADLAEPPRPAIRPALSLQMQDAAGDTMHLSLTLGATGTLAIGSITGAVARSATWRFVGCEAAQGAPLLACNDTGNSVRLAAAWVEGAPTGSLVVLSFVRATPSAAVPSSASPEWALSVSEAHAVGGQALTERLDVRAEIVR